jgi:hypothetical protein
MKTDSDWSESGGKMLKDGKWKLEGGFETKGEVVSVDFGLLKNF